MTIHGEKPDFGTNFENVPGQNNTEGTMGAHKVSPQKEHRKSQTGQSLKPIPLPSDTTPASPPHPLHGKSASTQLTGTPEHAASKVEAVIQSDKKRAHPPVSTRIAERMEYYNGVLFEFEEPMKGLKKLLSKSEKEGKKDAITPQNLSTLSRQLYDGTMKWNTTLRKLTDDYFRYGDNPKFQTFYKDRCDYIEVQIDDLRDLQKNFQKALSSSPFYTEGLQKGEEKLSDLIKSLEETQAIMVKAIKFVKEGKHKIAD